MLETASNSLATHYLTQAIEVGIDTAEGGRLGDMLELLVLGKALYLSDITDSPNKSTPQADRFVTNGEVGLILGNYYNVSGRETEAMACFTAQVKEYVRLLSDNDPSNDGMIYIYLRLAEVLAGIGDIERAVSMWHQSFSLDIYDSNQGGSAICKGCHKLVDISNIFICRYCPNVLFCANCLQQRKGGTLAVNICSQKHDWVLLPPMPEPVQKRAEEQKDMVLMDGEWVSLVEFKLQLRLKWGIKKA